MKKRLTLSETDDIITKSSKTNGGITLITQGNFLKKSLTNNNSFVKIIKSLKTAAQLVEKLLKKLL